MTIYFDMDGTIANLYGVTNWLEYIKAESTKPYVQARPLVNMQRLAHRLNNLQKKGYKIGIISWLAKQATQEYNTKVTQAKQQWLHKHLTSVKFDEVLIVEYGTPKHLLGQGILFDDEKLNRNSWGKGAYAPNEIFQVLAELA